MKHLHEIPPNHLQSRRGRRCPERLPGVFAGLHRLRLHQPGARRRFRRLRRFRRRALPAPGPCGGAAPGAARAGGGSGGGGGRTGMGPTNPWNPWNFHGKFMGERGIQWDKMVNHG